jgi:predicted kinase
MMKPLLVVFLGHAGSGKTYFSRNLAKKINAVTLNTDALRLSMFGSLERISEIRSSDKSRLYTDVFGAMDYAARQILLAGHSVVYDAQQTKRENRRNIEKIAEEAGAIPVLVWLKTSRETAIKRAQERDERDDSLRYTAEKIAYLVDRFDSETDLPGSDENVIEISGEVSFEVQFDTFMRYIENLEQS